MKKLVSLDITICSYKLQKGLYIILKTIKPEEIVYTNSKWEIQENTSNDTVEEREKENVNNRKNLDLLLVPSMLL